MARNKTSGKGAEKKVAAKKASVQKPAPVRSAAPAAKPGAAKASGKSAPAPAPAAKTTPMKAEATKKPVPAPKKQEKSIEKPSVAKAAPVKAPAAAPAPAQAAKPAAAPKAAAPAKSAQSAPAQSAPAKSAAPAKAAAPKPAMAPQKMPVAAALAKATQTAAATGARAIPASAKPQAQTITAPANTAGKPAGQAAAPAAAAAAQNAAAKKNVSARHGFKTSEWIVYPAHGVGRIVGIEEQEIAGISLELFVITFEKDKMTLRVPTGKSASVGMRKLSEEGTVKKAMETLKGKARVKRTMWSRRAQEYEAKINSGDLIAIAEVVRDLYRSESQPEQSYSERQLYEAALDRMAREIAAVEKLDERGAVQRITDVLSKSAKGRRGGEEGAADAEIKAA
jgi:CarD family transcriptional regulator